MPDTNLTSLDVDVLKVAGVAITATPAELNALHGQAASAADLAKLHAITAAAAEINASAPLGATGVVAGYKIARGETALDGSNPTPVVTGLTTVVGFSATLKGTAAPGDNTSVLTADISVGTVNVYAWKNTGGSDPTLVASTGTESFYWIAIGT